MDELNSILQVYKEQSAVVTLLKKEYYKTLNLTKDQDWKNAAIRLQERESSAAGSAARDAAANEVKHVDERINSWVDADPLRAIEDRMLEFRGLLSQAERTYNAVSHFHVISINHF